MEIEVINVTVTVAVGALTAVATIYAAFVQANRSNLYAAADMKALTCEMSVLICATPGVQDGVVVRLVDKGTAGDEPIDGCQLSLLARPAFLDDLGCQPLDGEVLLFLRSCYFKAGDADQPLHYGLVVVTNRRIVCRESVRLSKHTPRPGVWFDFETFWDSPGNRTAYGRVGYTHPAGVLVDGKNLKSHRVRIQSDQTFLVEGQPFEQLYVWLSLGLFESREKVTRILFATAQIATSPEGQALAIPSANAAIALGQFKSAG